jgi:predicted membrane channel-forming protein YqfA (hemolysin III family)
MSDDLDLMLSRPLDEPDEGAFSTRVLARLRQMQARDDRIEIAAWVLAACCILAILPMTGAGRMIALSASQLATSIPFALGITLLFLMRTFWETWAEG